jgi:hypothetical protein
MEPPPIRLDPEIFHVAFFFGFPKEHEGRVGCTATAAGGSDSTPNILIALRPAALLVTSSAMPVTPMNRPKP